MKPRLTQLVPLFALIALTSGMAGAPLQASIITLTGGDAADASDGIGYVPATFPTYAYRMVYKDTFHNFSFDNNAYTYKGITFQPYGLSGYTITPTFGTSTVGSVTSQDDFFYPAGAAQNIGTGGGSLSADDTLLFDVAKYQGFGATNYNGNLGTETITLGGLIAGRAYQVDLFSANNGSGSDPYTFVTSGAPLSSFTDILASHTAGIAYDIRETVTADSSGNITVTGTDVGPGSGNATINAFSVELTPEPASVALLACGSLLLLRRRRA